MTTLETIRPVATPGRISQGTAIEQSRAIAQVQAMVIVAQQCPRSVTAAVRAMEEACRQYELAQRAFFRFPRAGETVSGPSVHLARELARCWGNIEHGVTELRRDDFASESEMQAFAWDLETNTRSAAIFIVPHKLDTKKGVKELTDMRDIYENNANNGARRLREAIFSVLPVWYRERAMALCTQTLEDGGGKPLAQRLAEAVAAFERYGVSPARMAAKFGRKNVDDLTAADVGQLGVIYDSLRQGTVTVGDEFPPEPASVTAADITGQPKADKPARQRGKPAAPQDVPPAPAASPVAARSPSGAGGTSAGGGERPPSPASSGQADMIGRRAEKFGYSPAPDDQEAWLRVVARLAGTGELADVKRLTQDQAKQVIRQLDACKDAAALEDLLNDGVVAEEEARGE